HYFESSCSHSGYLILRIQETEYECECSRCWDTVASTESLDWITVSLMECPLRFNDTTIRKRIASWINEECNASFNCGLRNQLDENHIVIGHFECEVERNELRLVALLNRTLGLHQVICSVNKSPLKIFQFERRCSSSFRECSSGSSPRTCTANKRTSTFVSSSLGNSFSDCSQTAKRNPFVKTISSRTAVVILVAMTVFTFFMFLLIYFSQVYVNWSRIVKGDWSHKDYRKVPHVQYSSERITMNGQIAPERPNFETQY
ncbi:hypothetical protein OSTOST_10030, partial [Ostertagia ostertagi]